MTNELRQGQLWEDARAISTSLALLAELQPNLGGGGRVAREILILTAAAVVDHSAVYLKNSSSNGVLVAINRVFGSWPKSPWHIAYQPLLGSGWC